MTIQSLRSLTYFLSFLLISNLANALQHLPIQGQDLLTGKPVNLEIGSSKGVAVIFLSAVCPCSNSHMEELAALNKEYPQFKFVAVHSNADETEELAKKFFQAANLPFPVIQDEHTKIANDLKALKTPHAFLFAANGDLVYQGGVSSSRQFQTADRKYLREAIEDIAKGRKVRTPEGRTLGCIISRIERHE